MMDSSFNGNIPSGTAYSDFVQAFGEPPIMAGDNFAPNPALLQTGSIPIDTSADSVMTQFAGHIIDSTSGRSDSEGTDTSNRKSASPEKQVVDNRAAPLMSTHPRLKVEDALQYLDRVKMIFLHKPKVYNDFLDIMKEFKSQSLDTPGVINRVANLFHGHRELIVGFNAFLPHGYKIDIADDDIVRVTIPGTNQVLTIADMMRPPSPISTRGEMDSGTRNKSNSPTSTVSADSDDESKGPSNERRQRSGENEGDDRADEPNGSQDRQSVPRTSTPSSQKGVEFDYAISYVNKIKTRFNDEPSRYKKFLEILHAYQGKFRLTGEKPIDETDVFKEVARLFSDHPDLMDDFSRFLPNACAMAGPVMSQVSQDRGRSRSRSPSSSPVPGSSYRQKKSGKLKHGKHARDDSSPGKPSKLDRRTRLYKEKMRQDGFDVSKSPSKRALKMSSREMKRIEAEARKAARNGMAADKPGRHRVEDLNLSQQMQKPPKAAARGPEELSTSPDEPSSGKLAQGKRQIYRVPFPMPVNRKKNKRLLSPSKSFQRTRLVSPSEALSFTTLDNFSLVDRIRRALPSNVFSVVIKIFETYVSRAISKGKLLEIMEKLLHHKPKLVQEFASFLQTKAVVRNGIDVAVREAEAVPEPSDPESRMARMKEYDTRAVETDFKAFERYTDSRSYRIRPDSLPKIKSSGSTELDLEVLNDKYISCPIFSEGSQFLIAKKNSAEETMFKVEDEKYEMDMLLASAESAMDAMMFFLEANQSASNRDRNITWEDAFLHRRIIAKLYTENAPTIMSHLISNPMIAIPTVLERLRQKHAQWIRVQNSMSEIWMEHAQRNASKIGDYKGSTFKATDMRFLRSRHLVHEMEKIYNERMDQESKNGDAVKTTSAPHLMLRYPKSLLILDDATFFITRYIKHCSAFAKTDKKQMIRFLLEFAYRALKMPDSTESRDSSDSSDDESDTERGQPVVPRISPSSADDEPSEQRGAKDSADMSDDEGNDMDTGKKSRSAALRDFPIAPLPWPELCQYSGNLRSIETDVDEDFMQETKRREKNRERIGRKLNPSLASLDSSYLLLIGNSPFFLFVRYHQLLCERLNSLHNSFQNLLTYTSGKIETPSYIVSKVCKPKLDIPVGRFWGVFIDRLLKLLDGNIDASVYEDEMREIFRKDAYLSFTLDRLIQSICRQMHHVVNQEKAKVVRNLWEEAVNYGGAGGSLSTATSRMDLEKQYESKVGELLKEQNCFKIVVFDSGRVTVDLIDSEEPEEQQPLCRNWKDFLAYCSTTFGLADGLREALLTRGPVFIARHHRQLSRHRKQTTRSVEDDEEDEDEDVNMDTSKLSDGEGPADFSLDDKTWLMTVNIRSQIESEDILGIKEDREPNTSWVIYRRRALQTAHETHRRVSQRRTVAFKRFMSEKWARKAQITQEKHKAFLSWMRADLNRYKQGNSVEPPYFVYHVNKSDESERLENVKPSWIVDAEETMNENDVEGDKDEDTAADSPVSDSEDDTETELEPKPKRLRKRESPETDA